MDKTDQEKAANNTDEISLKELIFKIRIWWKYLLSERTFIVIFSFIGVLIGFSYAFFKKKVYTATSTFMLEEGKGTAGALGQYAGIAPIAVLM